MSDLVVGKATGWKTLRQSEGRWTSPVFAHTWTEGVNQSRCASRFAEEAVGCFEPGTNARCGFHVSTGDAHLEYLLTEATNALAVIESDGPVLLGQNGFRAERASIAAICVPGATVHERKVLKNQFPSAKVYRDWEQMAADYARAVKDTAALAPEPSAARQMYFEWVHSATSRMLQARGERVLNEQVERSQRSATTRWFTKVVPNPAVL